MIGCAMASPPIVTTLVSDFNHNTFRIQNGPPVGGSISAVLPSVGTFLPILSELAPLALQLGQLGTLGGGLLPSLPSVQLPSLSFPFPVPVPSISPVTYSARSLIPYPYSIYGGARFH